jgi:hypothetical protein
MAVTTSCLAWGCGARDVGSFEPFAEALPVDLLDGQCTGDLDCVSTDPCMPTRCVQRACVALPRIDCDDGDPCTQDSCAGYPVTCKHDPVSPDLDGDGHFRPLPGVAAGADGACGDDCDDTQARALPGGRELCDGLDNDCNGVIDDGYDYVPSEGQPLLLSGQSEGGLGGVAHAGERFVVSLSYDVDHTQNRLTAIDPTGQIAFETDVALVNSDTFAGPLLWTGEALATAWEDRRDEDYEIYFNRLDADGNKLGPDVRLSYAPDFSLSPDLVFTGAEYIVAWDDRRLGLGQNHIFAQRIGADGTPVGTENVDLTPQAGSAASPSLALGTSTLALAYTELSLDRRATFALFDLELNQLGSEQLVSEPGAVSPLVTANAGEYLVTWHEHFDLPGSTIWGTRVSADGEPLLPQVALTPSEGFARTHSVLPLGDRLLLFWAQAPSSGGYDIYYQTLDTELRALGEPRRLTSGDGQALGPTPAFGNDGQLGVAYVDFADDRPRVYFTTLTCAGQ